MQERAAIGNRSAALGLVRSLLIYHAVPFRQARLRRLLAPLVPPGALVFELGAHVGNRVRALRRLGARVIAVEPQPAYAALLRRMFRDDARVTVVEAAVGAVAGEAELQVSDRYPTVSTLSVEWRRRVRTHRSFALVTWNRRVPVPVTTLDALIARFGEPTYVKMDIEGSEPAVLGGLGQPLAAFSFEYVPAALGDARTCVDLVARLGRYRFNWSPGESMRLAAPAWLDCDGIRAFLDSANARRKPGDIYCRRVV